MREVIPNELDKQLKHQDNVLARNARNARDPTRSIAAMSVAFKSL